MQIVITQWNVSNVKTFRGMFYNAKKFNQNLSKWNISSVIDASAMFQGAETFNQNLCSWGDQLVPFEKIVNTTNSTTTTTTTSSSSRQSPRNVSVTTMFGSSGCPLYDDPVLTDSIPTPFCASCTSAGTISSNVVTSFGLTMLFTMIGIIRTIYSSR
jgi:surface protein